MREPHPRYQEYEEGSPAGVNGKETPHNDTTGKRSSSCPALFEVVDCSETEETRSCEDEYDMVDTGSVVSVAAVAKVHAW